MLTLDYIQDSKKVFDALKDQQCKFFLTFNGFGAELKFPTIHPGRLESAFQVFSKPVIDLMHDCPAHESLAHQKGLNFPLRRLFSTDYQYAGIATDMGIQNVTFCPSITFPAALSAIEHHRERDIDVLLAIGTLSPDHTRQRIDRGTVKGRLYGAVFDEVTACAVADWQIDPIIELKRVLSSLDITLNYNVPDHRFLLTITLDYIKFARRRDLLAALSDLPVTLVPDRSGTYPNSFRIMEARSATELLGMMARSRIVVCPTTHNTGHHERPLSAFTASAAVVSAPNRLLSAHFSNGHNIVFGNNPQAMREHIEKLISDTSRASEIAARGHDRAMMLYHPAHLVSAILNQIG
ncbi:glycosyltransferase [Pseudochelatococcus sp. G4_1912]|uniref:glycosyltransferase family protein n=1 Tax=Pseudochelatococcus sp. G4_1912 TaxID=3114288 RepID=UPI0039C72F27